MSTEQNKQTVREFFEHFSAANVSAALDLLDDAVIWRVRLICPPLLNRPSK